MDDNELLKGIITRDEKALRTFYLRFSGKLLGFVKTKIQNEQDAQEVLQDVLFAFLESARDFQGECRLQTYLYSICQHKIIDYYRRKKFRHLVFSQLPQLEELISPLLNPEEVLDGVVLREKLKKTFQTILPKYAAILKLKYEEDLPVADIAFRFHATLKSTESLLFRARKAFSKAFIEE